MRYRSERVNRWAAGTFGVLAGLRFLLAIGALASGSPAAGLLELLLAGFFVTLALRVLSREFWIEGDVLVAANWRSWFGNRRIPLDAIAYFFLPMGLRGLNGVKVQLKDGRKVTLDGVRGRAPRPGEPPGYAARVVDELNAYLYRRPQAPPLGRPRLQPYRSWDPEVAGRRPQWSPEIDPYAIPRDPHQRQPYETRDPFRPRPPAQGWRLP